MTNKEKIENLEVLMDEASDLIAFLKVEPKLKMTINSEVIRERIEISEKSIADLTNKITKKEK